MFRSPSVSIFVLLFAFASHRAAAQSPLVHSQYVPRPTVDMPLSAAYADIPGSQHPVTIPAGTALITWSAHGQVSCTATTCTARLRPAIGSSSPVEGLPDDIAGTSSGSWATQTEAGNTIVKLQVAAFCESEGSSCRFLMDSPGSYSRDAMSWTLVVFPEANAGVPAVGGVGLVLTVVLLLGVGGALILRRPAPVGDSQKT